MTLQRCHMFLSLTHSDLRSLTPMAYVTWAPAGVANRALVGRERRRRGQGICLPNPAWSRSRSSPVPPPELQLLLAGLSSKVTVLVSLLALSGLEGWGKNEEYLLLTLLTPLEVVPSLNFFNPRC